MSFTRKFLICDSPEHAAFLDAFALEYLADTRGTQATEWSGVYERDDGVCGIEWESPLSDLLGSFIDPATYAESLPVVDESKDAVGVSDWSKLLPDPLL